MVGVGGCAPFTLVAAVVSVFACGVSGALVDAGVVREQFGGRCWSFELDDLGEVVCEHAVAAPDARAVVVA